MISDQIKAARSEGYTDEEIAQHLAASNSSVQKAMAEGYTAPEIIAYITGGKADTSKEPEVIVTYPQDQTSEKPPTESKAKADVKSSKVVSFLESVGKLSPLSPKQNKALVSATGKALTGLKYAYPFVPTAGAEMMSDLGRTQDLDVVIASKEQAIKKQLEKESVPRIVTGIAAEIGVGEGTKYAATRAGARRGPQTAAAGYVAGALSGGAVGSVLAQEIEGQEDISWGRVIRDSFLNLLPGTEVKGAPKAIKKVAEFASDAPIITYTSIGAVAGAGSSVAEQLIEGEGVSMGEVAESTAIAGGLGGGLGGLSKFLRSAGKKFANKTEYELEDLVAKGDPDAIGLLNFLLQDVPESELPKKTAKSLVTGIIKSAQSSFAPSKALTPAIMSAARRTEAAPQAQATLGEELGKRVDRAVKKAAKNYGPDVEERVWKYLSGETKDVPSQMLGKKGTEALIAAREEIDQLQIKVLANHYSGARLLDPAIKNAVEDTMNSRSYLTRSYRFFHDPTYKPTDADFEKAVRSLVKNGSSPETAREYMLELQSKRAGNPADLLKYMHSAKDGVLKSKNYDLPLEVRQYLGEYTTPGQKIAETQSKLSKMVEYDAADKSITDSLISNGMAKTAESTPHGWQKLVIRGNEKELDGQKLFVSPETARALKQVVGIHESARGNIAARATSDFYHAYVSASKAVKVLGNPPAYMVQLYGNISGVLQSLNNVFRGSGSGVMAGLGAFKQLARFQSIKTLRRNKHYKELGLTGQSLAYEDFVKSAMTGGGPSSNFVRALFAPLGKIYSGFDDTLRIVNFENYKAKIIKATGAKTKEQLDKAEQVAADIVNDIYPNYAHLNDSLKTLSQHGVMLSQFASFSLELLRNQANHVRIAKRMAEGKFAEDLAKAGLNVVKPQILERQGQKMMVGLTGMHAAAYGGIVAYNRTEGGFSEEKERVWRETGAAPWDAEGNTILKAGEDGDTVYSTTASYLFPVAQIQGYGQAMMRGQSFGEAAGKLFGAVVHDLGGDGSFAMRAMIEGMSNLDLDTGKVISHRDDLAGKTKEIANHVFKKSLEFGAAREFRKSRQQTKLVTTLRQLGVRVNKQSFRTGLQIKSKKIKDSLTALSSEMSGAGYKLEDKMLTPEQYEQEYQRLNTAYKQKGAALVRHFQNARLWPMSDDEIVQLMKDTNVGSIRILNAMQGKVPELPRSKELTARDIYDRDYADKPRSEQISMLYKEENRTMAMSIKDIIKGEERKRRTNETVIDSLYKAIPSNTGERARRILDDMAQSENPEAMEQRFLKTGVIDKNTLYHMRLLRKANK